MKKALSLVLALALTMGMLVLPAAAESAYADYSNGFAETVTIQIPVYDRGFEGWNVTDNYYTRWIQSEFGDKYNINVQYVAIGRSTEVQDFTQLIASGNAPNIIFHYDMPQAVNYYGMEALQALDVNEIAFYAPTYYEKLKDTIAQYGEMDGETVFVFAERDAIYYNWVTLIRQDWLDAVGMDMPANLDEYNAVLAAWKEAGLGVRGERLVNKSFTFDYGYRGASVEDAWMQLYSDLNIAPLTTDSARQYLQNLNYQYNNGLMDPEFYLKAEETAVVSDFVSGKTGTYGFYITNTTDVITSLMANNPEAKVSVLSPFASVPEGYNPWYFQYANYGMVMGISNNTTPEQRAAVWMLLDWMIQPENLFYLQNGVEGENYTLSEDGLAIPVADYAGESKRSNNNNKDYWCLVAEVATYGDEELDYKANLANLAPTGYEYLIEQSYAYDQQIKEFGLVNPVFTKVVEASTEYSADLNTLWQELYVACATCSEEDFEATYAEACQTYLDAGYQEILDEKQALIDEGAVK